MYSERERLCSRRHPAPLCRCSPGRGPSPCRPGSPESLLQDAAEGRHGRGWSRKWGTRRHWLSIPESVSLELTLYHCPLWGQSKYNPERTHGTQMPSDAYTATSEACRREQQQVAGVTADPTDHRTTPSPCPQPHIPGSARPGDLSEERVLALVPPGPLLEV